MKYLKIIIAQLDHKCQIYYSGRYRDDGFIFYHADTHKIDELFAIANNVHKFVKFTYAVSPTLQFPKSTDFCIK